MSKRIVAMATFPPRKAGMLEVVKRLLPQCDVFHIYMNGYTERPKELPDDPKLDIILAGPGCPDPDKGSHGKFHWVGLEDGYYCTVDDDILYPPGYIDALVAGVEKYGRKAIVGYHGGRYRCRENGPIPAGGFVRNHRILFPYDTATRKDIGVHTLGAGVMASYPRALGLDERAFASAYGSGDDEDIALFAQKNRVPLMRLASRAGWIQSNSTQWIINPLHLRSDYIHKSDAKIRSWTTWRLFKPDDGSERPVVSATSTAGRVPVASSSVRAHPGERQTDAGKQPEMAYAPSEEPGKVTVILPHYNRAIRCQCAIESILKQTHKDLELLIVDDCSTEAHFQQLANYVTQLGDKRVRLYRTSRNVGPYVCKNEMIIRATGKYITFQDSDDTSAPTRLAKQVALLKSRQSLELCTVRHVRPELSPRTYHVCFAATMYRSTAFARLGHFDTVRFGADAEFDARASVILGSAACGRVPEILYTAGWSNDCLTSVVPVGVPGIREDYVRAFKAYHSTQGIRSRIVYPTKERAFKVPPEMTVDIEGLEVKEFTGANIRPRIVVGMASYPPRKRGMLETVRRILPQCDVLHLYLNGYTTRPPELPMDPKLDIILAGPGCEFPDRGSHGKFHWVDAEEGYYCTVDDDILYPPDYIERLIEGVERYGRQAIVSYHGCKYHVVPPECGAIPEDNTTRAHRTQYDYRNTVEQDIAVHRGGAGVMACYPRAIGLTPDAFKSEPGSGDDEDVALFAQRNEVPIVRLAAKQGWLKADMKIALISAMADNPVAVRAGDTKLRSWKKWRLLPAIKTQA